MTDGADIITGRAQPARLVHVGKSAGFQVFPPELRQVGKRAVERFEIAVRDEKSIGEAARIERTENGRAPVEGSASPRETAGNEAQNTGLLFAMSTISRVDRRNAADRP